jgi:hypothetical protein
MNEGDLRLTPSHAADEFQGSFLGIETALFHWVGLALLAALGLFAGLYYGFGFDLLEAAPWAVLPPGVVVGYLLLGYQGKPPGYALDLFDTLLFGGNSIPPRKFPPHPFGDV